jgi:FMN phosphatase YigB (HAD superfamily)
MQDVRDAEGSVAHMIKAVLFDLDDTLLDINLTAFVARFLWGRAKILSRAARVPLPLAYAWQAQGYLEINAPGRRQDSLTNGEYFDRRVSELSGVPMDEASLVNAFGFYEREYIRRFRDGLVMARPQRGARKTVERAMSLGYTVALATNPTFSLAVDLVRMEWAHVDDLDFRLISHIGNSTRCKPEARYYQEFCAQLGLAPEECLMVGNDASRDFPRPDIGLCTAYVGHGLPQRAVWRGPIGELGNHLQEICATLDSQGAGNKV